LKREKKKKKRIYRIEKEKKMESEFKRNPWPKV